MHDKPDEGRQKEEERDLLTGLLKKDLAEVHIVSQLRKAWRDAFFV